jgi:hypothetical protein
MQDGREHLLAWVVQSDDPTSIKDEILVKCRPLGFATAVQAARPICDRRAQHGQRLAFCRSMADRTYPA